MKNKINEASVRIDVQGLESSDLDTLSRMLALAGQAERGSPQMGGMTSVPSIAPLNFDSIGGEEETQPIMSPDMAPSADDMGDAGAADLGAGESDLAGTVTDFGDDSLDMAGSSDVEFGSEDFGSDEEDSDFDSSGDDDFDMGLMSSLAGIRESQDLDEDFGDDAEDDAVAESLLPDLSLDEDSIATEADASKEFGPFRTEFECVANGQKETNGFEGDNFIVVPKGNAFYWKRTMQEDSANRPEPEFYDDEGIVNSRHAYKDKQPGTALGDNPLVGESDEEDESVDSIFESISTKYKKYMEGL